MTIAFEQNIDVKKVREVIECKFQGWNITHAINTGHIGWMVTIVRRKASLGLESDDPNYVRSLVRAALEDIQILRAGKRKRR